MRSFILTILAVSCVRGDLAAYSPARGQFPVQSGLAQGYIRYLDPNGAERLIAYTYPEPLYGVRRLPAAGYDIGNPLLKPTQQSAYLGQVYIQSGADDISKTREQNFREWCEQRFQALKSEVEQLRAAGQQPSADILNQMSSLEKVVTADSYYPSSSESLDITRSREEQLRLWNDARLKVLQLEAEQLKRQGISLASNKYSDADRTGAATYASNADGLVSVKETLEQQKARIEHLRLYNEHLIRLQQLGSDSIRDTGRDPAIATLLKNLQPAAQAELKTVQTPAQAAFDTPEVIRAKEEHLRLWNEAKLRAQQLKIPLSQKPEQDGAVRPIAAALKTSTTKSESGFLGSYQPAPVQDTPEVIRAREEHLKLLMAAQQTATPSYISEEPILANVQYLPQAASDNIEMDKEVERIETENRFLDAERLQEELRLKEEERLLEEERLREAERIREASKMLEIERLRESERLKEEERLMEAERLRLKLEDERREELERQAEAQRQASEQGTLTQLSIKAQALENNDNRLVDSTYAQSTPAKPVQQPQVANSIVLGDKRQDIPLFLRYAQPNANAAAGTYILGEPKPILPSTALYYAPTADYAGTFKSQNPFFVRYFAQGTQTGISKAQANIVGQTTVSLSDSVGIEGSKLKTELTPLSAIPITTYATGGALQATKVNYGNDASLSELEKATRDHFRAHEIALEQLRLANANNPSKKDC